LSNIIGQSSATAPIEQHRQSSRSRSSTAVHQRARHHQWTNIKIKSGAWRQRRMTLLAAARLW
jgi:hypothetical protein